MATTKIWPIKDSVKRVIEYARNPDKTELNDLAKAIHYASDGRKTQWFEDEKVYLVTTVNCNGDPYDAMMAVRKHFGDRGTILAHHAYQSFKPGEVTPEQCHQIGVELAQKLWGDRYQVMVATHLNRSHLHNHLILNPISFVDGKKINSGYTNYYSLREASDELCRKHGLSVIQNPKGKTPRSIYFAEKAGEPTRYNLLRQAIDQAVQRSWSWQDFELHLGDLGYEFDRNEGGKYPKIKAKNNKKWTRIYNLGEDYSLAAIEKAIRENTYKPLGSHAFQVGQIKKSNRYRQPPRQHWFNTTEPTYGPLLSVALLLVYLLGGPDLITPQDPAPQYHPITPEMREATRRCEMYSRQAVLMGKENIHTKADADAFLDRTERALAALERKRSDLYNRIRRCQDPELKAQIQSEIHGLSAQMKPLRRQISDIKNLLERSGVMQEMIEAEEKMRREQILREYMLSPQERAALQGTIPAKTGQAR